MLLGGVNQQVCSDGGAACRRVTVQRLFSPYQPKSQKASQRRLKLAVVLVLISDAVRRITQRRFTVCDSRETVAIRIVPAKLFAAL
jgi:hypothetical protein